MNKQIGIIGLGKMGSGIALNLAQKGWEVFAYNRTFEKALELEEFGIKACSSVSDLTSSLSHTKIILIILPAGEITNQAINEVSKNIFPGDYIIDAGNSFFEDTIENYKFLNSKKINFVDVGVSGGPSGARNGACLMVGGNKENFQHLEDLFKNIAGKDSYEFFPGAGAGHFVKMVHNAIEYGMMQSIAEGFNLLKHSKFKFDLKKISKLYNSGSVIDSRLIEWLNEGFEIFGEDLKKVSGKVVSSGEADWTLKTAKKLKLEMPVIHESVKFRKESQIKPSYTGKILTMLRHMFGGHDIK